MKPKDVIGETLNLGPMFEEEEETKRPPITIEQKPILVPDEQTDFEHVRRNLYDLIEKGARSLDELSAIADQSQNPRSYEVLSGMIKTLVDTNKDLLDIHEKKKKILSKENENASKTVNNNLYVGSTSELLKMIRDENEQSD